MAENAALRMAHWKGVEGYRPRSRVVKRLMDESAGWPDAQVETFAVAGEQNPSPGQENTVAVEFRIQATENQVPPRGLALWVQGICAA